MRPGQQRDESRVLVDMPSWVSLLLVAIFSHPNSLWIICWCYPSNQIICIEDITRWWIRCEFHVRVARTNLTSKQTSEINILFLPREHKIHISKLTFYYPFYYIDIQMTAFLTIFRRFLTTFLRFLKIFQNCSEGQMNVSEHFLKISEDFQRLPNTFDEDPKMFRLYTNNFKYNLRDQFDISEIIDIFASEDMENTPLESRI